MDHFADLKSDISRRPRSAMNGLMHRSKKKTLFDHLVGARDELASPHSITSSASSRNDSEMVSPIAFAVLRFTINS